jgi:hypothetical protein
MMNKQELFTLLEYINRVVLYIGILLIVIGASVYYQANHDVQVLDKTLSELSVHNSTHEVGLTTGDNYYMVYKYNTQVNFSAMDLINRSQCETLYGYK